MSAVQQTFSFWLYLTFHKIYLMTANMGGDTISFSNFIVTILRDHSKVRTIYIFVDLNRVCEKFDNDIFINRYESSGQTFISYHQFTNSSPLNTLFREHFVTISHFKNVHFLKLIFLMTQTKCLSSLVMIYFNTFWKHVRHLTNETQ